MKPDELRTLSDLLDQAIDLPPAEREAWLAGLQGQALLLAPTLRELLAKHALGETGELIGQLPPFTAPSADSLGSSEFQPGAQIGPYRLLRAIGRGGMGEVWLAERADGALKRQVALKLPMLSVRRSVLVQRFARERDILATLEHPNIARLYDAGIADDGQPYLALEYVQGLPIDHFCRQNAPTVKERLVLLLQVAEAVAFAHSRLVLHRDLKPSNILVTAPGQVRLLDFGVAKLMAGDSTEETELTRASGRAFTVDYASPEQLRGEALGTPSDIYSLGVVAFEVLTGTRPWRVTGLPKDASAAQRAEAIAKQEAPLASAAVQDTALSQRLRGDLDAILNQALKKRAAERYVSVDALAQDWRRHLEGQRVLARPDGWLYRVSRLARRYRVPMTVAIVGAAILALGIGAGATALVIAALVAGIGVASWQARSAALARDQALRTVERAEAVTGFLNTLLTDAARGGQAFTAQQLLQRSEQLIEREFPGGGEVHAVVLSMIGTTLQTLGNPAEAIRLHERAVAAGRASEDASLRDSLQANWALSIGWAGRVDEARSALLEILSHRSITAERRAEAHHYLAALCNSVQDASAALHHAEEAIRCLRACKRPSRKLEASMLASLGAACSLNRRMAEADRHFAAAFACLEALGQARSAQGVTMLNNWAVINERAGDAQRALWLADRALSFGADETARSPYIVINRARALEGIGRLPDAEAGYLEGLALARKCGAQPAIAAAQVGLVSLALHNGQMEQATALLADMGSSDALQREHPNRVAQILVEGRLAALRGDTETARSRFTEAIGAEPPLPTTVMGLIARAELHLQQGRSEAGLADGRKALALAIELQGGKPHSFRTGLAAVLVARAQSSLQLASSESAQLALAQLEPIVDGLHPALALARAATQGGFDAQPSPGGSRSGCA